MSVKTSVSALLASVCLFGVVAGGAVFAQDVVVDEVVVEQPAVDAPVDAVDTPVDTVEAVDPVVAEEEPAVVEDEAALLAAAPPPVIMAVPAPDEPTGYEGFDDAGLQAELARRQAFHTTWHNRTNYLIEECGWESCGAQIEDAISQRDFHSNVLDHVNEEIRRRSVVVEPAPTPEPKPVVAAVARPEVTADAKPPREFCAALTAKGDFSDCGWSYRQTQ